MTTPTTLQRLSLRDHLSLSVTSLEIVLRRQISRNSFVKPMKILRIGENVFVPMKESMQHDRKDASLVTLAAAPLVALLRIGDLGHNAISTDLAVAGWRMRRRCRRVLLFLFPLLQMPLPRGIDAVFEQRTNDYRSEKSFHRDFRPEKDEHREIDGRRLRERVCKFRRVSISLASETSL